MNKENIKNFIPGFTMGVVRATISHPFEILKLKSQMGQTESFYKNLFKGVHYSIISNSLERGLQFGLFEKFKKNDSNIISSLKSSLISTTLSLPYNIILLKKVILSSASLFLPKNIFYKSIGLEYTRNLSGSVIFLSSYNSLKDNNIPIIFRAPIASCIVWSITYPIDSYKNIIIANNSQNNIFNFNRLYKGIQYPMMRSIPSSIIGFYVYEFMLDYCKNM